MAQVVAHLLHNAARFSVRPGRIWVSTYRDASYVRVLTVRDEGIGIEAKTLPSIFDRFMSAAASERGNGGMGRPYVGSRIDRVARRLGRGP